MKQANRTTGFTLTELMIVITLAAVLLAIAFGAFQRVGIASKQAISLNNLRVVGRGLLAWTMENNRGRFPYAFINPNGAYPAGYDVSSLPKYQYWAGEVYHSGHVDNPEVFFSPLQKTYWKDPAFNKRLRADKNAWQWGMVGYGVSGIWMPYATDVQGRPTASINTVPEPGKAILLAEAAPNASQSKDGAYDGFHAVLPGRMTYPLAVRSPGQVLTFFVDGHAEVLAPAAAGWDEENHKWAATIDHYAFPWGKRQ